MLALVDGGIDCLQEGKRRLEKQRKKQKKKINKE